jgi:hypothetical protein
MVSEKHRLQLAAARAARWAKPGASERQSQRNREMHKDTARKSKIIAALHAPEAREKAQAAIKRGRLPLRERFFAKTEKSGDCLVWTGSADASGYGEIRIGGKLYQATHIALELDGRAKPFDGAIALHSCDNPPCVDASHLRWGTQKDNVNDAISRGRMNTSGLCLGRGKWWPR